MTNILRALIFFILAIIPNMTHALEAFPEGYKKKRVIITTDIGGGDKDDTQSMIHFLLYADMFDLEGIVISRPGGNIDEMKKVLSAYKKDHKNLSFHSADYPTAEQILRVTKVGASRRNHSPSMGYSKPTAGSRLIIKAARKDDPRPLHVIVWGSITDVAQALHDAKDIHPKLRIYSGSRGGFNEDGDPTPYRYMRKIKDKRFLWYDTAGMSGGFFLSWMKSKHKYGNVGFVEKVVRHRGHLGRLFYNISRTINVNAYGIKMGDTPFLLYLFNGDFDHPHRESWGGRVCRVARNYYQECDGDMFDGGYSEGNKIVRKYRTQVLKDWEKRTLRLLPVEI